MPQKLRHKVLKVDGDEAIAVVVVLFERVGHALECDAGLHEQVKGNDATVLAVVVFKQELNEAVGQAVLEGHQGVLELVHGDVAAAVRVEAVEDGAPAVQELPEADKLLEVEVAAAVGIKHAHHHVDGVGVELGAVAVDEVLGKLFLGDVADA